MALPRLPISAVRKSLSACCKSVSARGIWFAGFASAAHWIAGQATLLRLRPKRICATPPSPVGAYEQREAAIGCAAVVKILDSLFPPALRTASRASSLLQGDALAANPMNTAMIVPTLCVVMAFRTLCVRILTRSVGGGMPTRSVGTISASLLTLHFSLFTSHAPRTTHHASRPRR
jgi:hypothetical protein